MTRFARTPTARLGLALLSLSISSALYAQSAPAPTASDWGGIGLLQTPTARMADDGELSFTASHTSPYSRYNVVLQPLPWLEGAFRYVSVANRRYGPEWLSGNQTYKDKSIDFKVRLLEEGRISPAIAAGIRDVGGTGQFSSEYLVASKNFGAFDVSLGMATGYIGNRGGISNPIGWIDEDFKTRPDQFRGVEEAGRFNSNSMFKGPIGVFGGVAYQTPLDGLQLKLEYDGNDYKHEPQRNNQRQRSPLNLGASIEVNKNVQLHVGWERGDTAMIGVSLHTNLDKMRSTPKLLDPEPFEIRRAARGSGAQMQGFAATTSPDLRQVAIDLETNAGLKVDRIYRRGSEVVVSGEQRRFFYPAQGVGRASRIVSSHFGPQVDWVTVENTRLGLPVVETSVELDALGAFLDNDIELPQLARHIEMTPPIGNRGELLYKAPFKPYSGAFNMGYSQSVGGPDGFVLFQVAATYTANLQFTRNIWLNGTVSYNAYNNYEKFRYDAPSNLPRVRTYVRQYLTTEDLTLPSLQLTATRQLGRDLYASAYGGLLEPMYGGVGSEVLYRPMNERWAVGAELNWVKQRDFDQRLNFRNYNVTTGHASFYYVWGSDHKVVTTLSAGRYLAKDWGATMAVARAFDNGVSMGAYATKTDVSSRDFGEGSFDKGIFVSVPFDFLIPRSTRARANFAWNPLYRDGGARLSRSYSLYQLTSERDPDFFFDNLDVISK